MSPRKKPESGYCEAVERFGEGTDSLYSYLQTHRYDDLSMFLGYLIERAKRDPTSGIQTQSDAAEAAGRSRSMISAILFGKTLPSRETYMQLAKVLRANPLEFFIADGTIDPPWVEAYNLDPEAAELAQVVQLFATLPAGERRRIARLLVLMLEVLLGRRNDDSRLDPLTRSKRLIDR